MKARDYVLDSPLGNGPANSTTEATTTEAGVPRPRNAAPTRREALRRVPGLSKGHNRTEIEPNHRYRPAMPSPWGNSATQIRSLRWHKSAGLVELPSLDTSLWDEVTEAEQEKPKRGKITEWSAKSRLRMKRLLSSLVRDKVLLGRFVTLTYPAEFPAADDHAIYKAHLHRFGQELRRKYPGMSAIWKLEFQSRGAPHYHLAVFGIADRCITEMRQWTAETWYRIVASGDKNHFKAGTGVEACRSVGGLNCYLASYISKQDQTMPGNFTGRYWGVIDRTGLPVGELVALPVTEQQAIRINRIRRKLVQVRVQESAWRRFTEARANLAGNFMHWSRTEFEHLWSRYRSRRGDLRGTFMEFTTRLGGCMVFVRSCLLPSVGINEEKIFRPPSRWRMRNNSGGFVFCDADSFMGAIKRGIERNCI